MADDDAGFLSRWARRKAQTRAGMTPAPEPEAPPRPQAPAVPASMPVAPTSGRASVAAASADVATGGAASAAEVAPPPLPPPTLADVAALTRESDYSRFVAGGVDEGVKHAAMRKLFSDPHFNVMDGLDTYIDDYGQPDPIPLAMLRKMNQSQVLRLFEADEATDEAIDSAAPVLADRAAEPAKPPDDDPDLRLQQDDVAGRPGPAEGPRA